MIIQGSMNHTYSGRKKKRVAKVKRTQKPFIPLAKEERVFKPAPWAGTDREFKSTPLSAYTVPNDTSYRQEVSKKYTVAIAFNKGAYQVIPNEDIEHIGK